MREKVLLFYENHKRLIFSLGIFLIIFLLLGIPYTNWGFSGDSFGIVWHSMIKSLSDFFRFFNGVGTSAVLKPSNYVVPEQSFFVVYYRPFVYVFCALQILFFKVSAYGYFLVTIFLHSLNAVLLFNLFLYFVDYILAFWAALFFAFHPSLCDWLGWIAGQQHVLNFLLILLVIIFFKRYLDSKNIAFYILSCFFFLLSLFTRETAIVIPFWLACFMYMYEKHVYHRYFGFFKSFFRYMIVCSGFWLLTIFYFILRIILYPINLSGASQIELSPINFILNFKDRFFQMVTLLSDLAGLSFMPGGNRILKGSLISIFFSLLFWLFIKNTRKRFILFFAFSMILIMWPAILRYYATRYLYKAFPFFILIILFLFRYYKFNSQSFQLKFQKVSRFVIYSILIFNIIFLVFYFKKRELLLYKVNLAFDQLCKNKKVEGRILCFLGLPSSLFPTSVAQAVWMHGKNLNLPIYHDRKTLGCGHVAIFKNYLNIIPIKNGFRIFTINPEKLWLGSIWQEELAMGKKVINATKDGKVVDASFIFDKKYLDQNLLFVTWDYEKSEFKILNASDKNKGKV